MWSLEITSPQPVALSRDYLWQLAVLAMSIPSRSTLFEQFIFKSDNVIIIYIPILSNDHTANGDFCAATIAPVLLDLEIRLLLRILRPS